LTEIGSVGSFRCGFTLSIVIDCKSSSIKDSCTGGADYTEVNFIAGL
jgi:hypothetical protein